MGSCPSSCCFCRRRRGRRRRRTNDQHENSFTRWWEHLTYWLPDIQPIRPRGLMDKASDFESEDSRFESWRGHILRHLAVSWILKTELEEYLDYSIKCALSVRMFQIRNRVEMTHVINCNSSDQKTRKMTCCTGLNRLGGTTKPVNGTLVNMQFLSIKVSAKV